MPKQTTMDYVKLIEAVRSRPALWNVREADYSRRPKVNRLWLEVAEEMHCSKDEVTKKWKNLRDNFRQEQRKLSALQRSGKASSDVYKRKWVYFEKLMFLTDVVRPATRSGSLPEFPESSGGSSGTSPLVTASGEHSQEDIAGVVSAVSTPTPHIPSKDSRRKKARAEDPYLTVEKEEPLLLRKDSDMKSDGDFHFLMSLHPIMKEMSMLTNVRFRSKVSALAEEYLIKEKEK